MTDNIKIIRSARKTVSLEIKPDVQIIVRAPLFMKTGDIERFVEEKSDWLQKHLEIVRLRSEEAKKQAALPCFTDEEIREMTKKAKHVIAERVAHYAALMGVQYGNITIRHQVSRWGSCSAKKNLSFNCLLMLCPDEVVDYVVIHELCHIKEMNHSPRFWAEVEKLMPDWRRHKKWLRENGGSLISRIKR